VQGERVAGHQRAQRKARAIACEFRARGGRRLSAGVGGGAGCCDTRGYEGTHPSDGLRSAASGSVGCLDTTTLTGSGGPAPFARRRCDVPYPLSTGVLTSRREPRCRAQLRAAGRRSRLLPRDSRAASWCATQGVLEQDTDLHSGPAGQHLALDAGQPPQTRKPVILKKPHGQAQRRTRSPAHWSRPAGQSRSRRMIGPIAGLGASEWSVYSITRGGHHDVDRCGDKRVGRPSGPALQRNQGRAAIHAPLVRGRGRRIQEIDGMGTHPEDGN